MTTSKQKITIEATINQSIEKVWKAWTTPADIMIWNTASEDWHTTKAENDLRVGGKFLSRMEAKDGSFGFDFIGTYAAVKNNELIAYTMEDGRECITNFSQQGNTTHIVTTFDAEDTNPIEMQKGGWQAILNNFKKYAEAHS